MGEWIVEAKGHSEARSHGSEPQIAAYSELLHSLHPMIINHITQITPPTELRTYEIIQQRAVIQEKLITAEKSLGVKRDHVFSDSCEWDFELPMTESLPELLERFELLARIQIANLAQAGCDVRDARIGLVQFRNFRIKFNAPFSNPQAISGFKLEPPDQGQGPTR